MMNAPDRGQVITFYSYKGGTGRTMALANIACLLATDQAAKGGKPVLAIDWDLEAPGLHRYFEPFLQNEKPEQEGLIELLADLRSRVRTGLAPDEEEEMSEEVVSALDVMRYAAPTSYPKLSFIRAGHIDDTYSTRTNTFPWAELFSTAPSLFRLLADRLAEEFSYVLIDSRTGITDTSGICTTLMPEKLVVVFTPNRQSLTGITELVKRAYAYRRGSDDVRPLVVYPLPSRIETSLPQEMKRWRLGDESEGIVGWELQFTELLRGVYELPESFSLERYFDAVQAQHVPPYAYGEPIAVLRERNSDRLTLTKSYDTFRGYLVRSAPWDEQVSPADEAARQAALEQLNRLNDEFRQATEAVRPTGTGASASAAPIPIPQLQTAPVPKSRVAMAVFAVVMIGVMIAGYFLFRREEAVVDPDPLSTNNYSAFSLILADVDRNDPSTTALLLAASLDGLHPKEKGLAEDQLRVRLSLMPAPHRVQTGPVASISLLRTRLLVVDAAGKLHRFDLETFEPLAVPAKQFAAAAERPDGSFVTVTPQGLFEVWDGPDEPTASESAGGPGSYKFGPQGKLLLVSSARRLRLWSVGGGEPRASKVASFGSYTRAWASIPALRTLTRLADIPEGSATFSGDGRTVAVQTGAGIVLVSTNSRPVSINAPKSQVVVLDQRGEKVAIVIPGDTSVRDVPKKKVIKIASVPSALAFDIAGESLLAITPVNILQRFDAQTGVQMGALSYQDDLRAADFLDDGRAIVTFGDRIEVGAPLVERDTLTIEPPGPMKAIAYDGNLLAVANEDSVRVWRLEMQTPDKALTGTDLVEEVCRRVERDLTDQEWTTYFGSVPKKPVCQITNQETPAP